MTTPILTAEEFEKLGGHFEVNLLGSYGGDNPSWQYDDIEVEAHLNRAWGGVFLEGHRGFQNRSDFRSSAEFETMKQDAVNKWAQHSAAWPSLYVAQGVLRPKNVTFINYSRLEELILEHLGAEFELVAEEECSNDSLLEFDLEPNEQPEDEYSPTARHLLSLAHMGVITFGSYIVEVCW